MAKRKSPSRKPGGKSARRSAGTKMGARGVAPVDIRKSPAGKASVALQRPRPSGKRTKWGDDEYGWGFGALLGVWRPDQFPSKLRQRDEVIPLQALPDERRPEVITRLMKAGLTERIRAAELTVLLWDDGESVHIQGKPEDVQCVADMVREAVEFVASQERARRGFANAASNTFGLLKAEVLAVEGGWRDARMLDGEFFGWLCPHIHPTKRDAENCPNRESVLKTPREPSEEGPAKGR